MMNDVEQYQRMKVNEEREIKCTEQEGISNVVSVCGVYTWNKVKMEDER